MLQGRLGHVPRGSDDENVTLFNLHQAPLGRNVFWPSVLLDREPIKASGCRMGETRSEVGRSASRGAGSKFFNDLIMIDR